MTRLFAILSFAVLSAGLTFAPLAAAAQEDAAPEPVEIQQMSLGAEDAPVTVIEYASFTCPHCRDFHANTFEQLREDYIDTGDVRWIYREVYFDRFGLWASMLARCGGEERFFGLVDLIYENQSEWVQGDDPAAIAENLRRLGRTAGMEDETLNACLQDAAKAQALVAWYQENAEADDIQSTPSFVIDGELYNNMPYDEFSKILDEKLAG